MWQFEWRVTSLTEVSFKINVVPWRKIFSENHTENHKISSQNRQKNRQKLSVSKNYSVGFCRFGKTDKMSTKTDKGALSVYIPAWEGYLAKIIIMNGTWDGYLAKSIIIFGPGRAIWQKIIIFGPGRAIWQKNHHFCDLGWLSGKKFLRLFFWIVRLRVSCAFRLKRTY